MFKWKYRIIIDIQTKRKHHLHFIFRVLIRRLFWCHGKWWNGICDFFKFHLMICLEKLIYCNSFQLFENFLHFPHAICHFSQFIGIFDGKLRISCRYHSLSATANQRYWIVTSYRIGGHIIWIHKSWRCIVRARDFNSTGGTFFFFFWCFSHFHVQLIFLSPDASRQRTMGKNRFELCCLHKTRALNIWIGLCSVWYGFNTVCNVLRKWA